MVKDIQGKELKVGQTIEDIMCCEVAKVIEILEPDRIRIKYFGEENLDKDEILEVKGEEVEIVASSNLGRKDMITVFITEKRRGSEFVDTYSKKLFESFDELIGWIDGMDNTQDKQFTYLVSKLNNLKGISIKNDTRIHGSIYDYIVTRIETEEGIHYDRKISCDNCSKELGVYIDKFVKKITTPKKLLF
ncbi:MAG: hypothetical protein E7E64_05100 [Clostridium celatum]|uniref:hypothetical protein n=1 Tax=Clostridium tertium TaxID=1559 RepID=UPI002903F6CB|nr:hypothetical protein [Clostridium celatum]